MFSFFQTFEREVLPTLNVTIILQIIRFVIWYVDNSARFCEAEFGMTWFDYVNSGFNAGGYELKGYDSVEECSYIGTSRGDYVYEYINGGSVTSRSEIISDHSYYCLTEDEDNEVNDIT